jgi:hypothetical protein
MKILIILSSISVLVSYADFKTSFFSYYQVFSWSYGSRGQGFGKCSDIGLGTKSDLPEKIQVVFKLRNGQETDKFTPQISFNASCVDSNYLNQKDYGIDVDWKNVVGADYYRTSTQGNAKEEIASCVRPTLSASPTPSPTISSSPSPSPSPTTNKSASPTKTPSPAVGPSPAASKSVIASDIVSVTPTPKKTASPKKTPASKPTPTPSRKSKFTWQVAPVVNAVKSSWKAASNWFSSIWGR